MGEVRLVGVRMLKVLNIRFVFLGGHGHALVYCVVGECGVLLLESLGDRHC